MKDFRRINLLTEKLTFKQQRAILADLFGFDYIDKGDGFESFVLYDEEGEEFYGNNENLQFDFSTLAGIFSYTAYRAKNQGYRDCQYALRKQLGL